MQVTEGYLGTPDGVRLFFQKLGTGPRCVLIPNGMYLFGGFQRLAETHTVIFYDARNRGRSDTVTDPSKLARGIQNDIDDLETVRLHFGISPIAVIGHSYMGWVAGRYAIKYPGHVDRLVQIGPMQPDPAKQYPAHLTNADATFQEIIAKLGQMQKQPREGTPEERCMQTWKVLSQLYVADPADAEKIRFIRCDLANERNLMPYWTGIILPSAHKHPVNPDEAAKVTIPVLTIHGTKDRSAPYGGGREWSMMFPNARLLSVENCGHAPWVESPDSVYPAIQTFLDGTWPAFAHPVTALDPQ